MVGNQVFLYFICLNWVSIKNPMFIVYKWIKHWVSNKKKLRGERDKKLKAATINQGETTNIINNKKSYRKKNTVLVYNEKALSNT